MNKTIFCGLLMGMLAVAPSQAAETAPYTYTIEDNRATITSIATNATGELVVPATLGNCPVTALGRSAFLDRPNITRITFAAEASVTNLGAAAFQGCTRLAAVAVPAGLTSLAPGLFSGCTSLVSVAIPTGVTSIGDLAFADCRSLPSLNLPAGLTALGESAFLNCRSLTALDLPDGITAIPGQLCGECRALTSIKLPSRVTSIGYGAFYNCAGLAAITLPPSVTTVGREAFYGCRNLSSLALDGALTSVGDRACYGCASLKTLWFNAGVAGLGEAVFGNCPSLAGVYFVGDAPTLGADQGADMFLPAGDVAISYWSSSSSWGDTFCGVAAGAWRPEISAATTAGSFTLTVRWVSGQTIRVQACGDLANPYWSDLGTSTLTGGSCLVSDPDSGAYSQRYYRVLTASD